MSKAIIMLGAGLILLPGCKPAANDANALLKAGDARICVAPEVEDTLREMIAPKPDLAKAYSVTFSNATLESYDPQVHKALCNTSVTVQGPGGALIDHAPLNISVSPSARDDSQFLVTAQGIEAYHQQLVEDNAGRAEREASDQEDTEAQERLIAMVKPGWLIGRWVNTTDGSDSCANGPNLEFVRGGTILAANGQGRWKLTDQDISIVWPTAGTRMTVIGATDETMSVLVEKGQAQEFRRCAPAEMQPIVQPDVASDTMPSIDQSGGDTFLPSGE